MPRTITRLMISLASSLALVVAIELTMERPSDALAQRHHNRLVANLIAVTTTIQAAINSAKPGDSVLIPPGLYTESLTLSKAVSLVGRDRNNTIIQALDGQRVLTVTGATITQTTLISGLTFMGGDVLSTPPTVTQGTVLKPRVQIEGTCPLNCGGGILITETAHPLIQSVIISGNHAFHGGGLYAELGSPLTLKDVNFTNNSSGAGGGVFAADAITLLDGTLEGNESVFQGGGVAAASRLTIIGVKFINNIGGSGGGAYSDDLVAIAGARFENNRSKGSGGALYTVGVLSMSETVLIGNNAFDSGGGAYTADAVTLSGGRFENNRTTRFGGGGLFATGDGPVAIIDTEFVSNTAQSHGGALSTNGLTTLIQGRFANNVSNRNGGGIYAASALTLTLSDTALMSNTAQNGGGVYALSPLMVNRSKFISNSVTVDGGAIYHAGVGDSRITNALLTRNGAARTGAGLYLNSSGRVELLHATIAGVNLNPQAAILIANGSVGITNTIVASHSMAMSMMSGSVFEDYNLFFANSLFLSSAVSSGGHSFVADPMFAAPTGDDYHLRLESPAIDNGAYAVVSMDLDSNRRPIGSGFDIGAYEYPKALYRRYFPFLPLSAARP